MSGRRRSSSLTVRADVAPPHVARLVIRGLLALGAVTVAGAPVQEADGAGPTTIASVFVALIIVLGGPRLLSTVRRRAARSASAS